MDNNTKAKFDVKKSPKTFDYVLARLTKNVRCNRCNRPVILSDAPGYSYQCLSCDEDLYKIETHNSIHFTVDELEKNLELARDYFLLYKKTEPKLKYELVTPADINNLTIDGLSVVELLGNAIEDLNNAKEIITSELGVVEYSQYIDDINSFVSRIDDLINYIGDTL